MTRFTPFIFIFVLLACQTEKSPFFEVDCVPEQVNSNPGYETIYKPCRAFIFRAQYWDADYDLISDQRIWMMATGNRWEFDDGQAELFIQYEYDEADVARIQSYNINPPLNDRSWQKFETTGFIEGQSSLWMHPFRSNQYLFTEVAPLPIVEYTKLDLYSEWKSGLNIGYGWGEWEDTHLDYTYQVTDVVDLDLEIGNIKDCFHISSIATAPFGNSQFDFWFSFRYGIVKMIYRNYLGQILLIELQEVKES